MEKLFYFDNAATTKIHPDVLGEMLPFYTEIYSNSAGVYDFAEASDEAVEKARVNVSKLISSESSEIYFTSGGTESDNWALKSVAYMLKNRGRHIITSKIEHPAVLNTCKFLEKMGFKVTYLDVDEFGMINTRMLEKAIRKDTIIISIMFANNEVGTIQPIGEIGEIAKKHGIIFHTDAVQAVGQIPINVKELKIDLLSSSAHKFYGPKGIGFMYIDKKLNIPPFIHGGSHERNMRAGTLNVPGIVGLGKASEIACTNLENKIEKEIKLREYLINAVLKEIPESKLNGHRNIRLPNNANFSFKNVNGEALAVILDTLGICSSSGSACSSGKKKPSHVLLAMGRNQIESYSALRLTLSDNTTKDEVEYLIKSLKESVDKLRKIYAYEN